MEPSSLGKASCIILGLEVGWCSVILGLLFIMHTGSLLTFNQSFLVLTMPVVGLFSALGLLCGLAGGFAQNTNKTLSWIGTASNGIVLTVIILLAL
jgi:hypothetical protein